MICSHPRSYSLPVGNRLPAHDHFSLDNAEASLDLGRNPYCRQGHSLIPTGPKEGRDLRHRHIIAAIVLGALLSLAGQAQAQRKSPEERYEDLKKTPLLAATLEWIVPITGHDYAGDRDAALPSAVLLGVVVSLFAGAVYHADRCQSPFPP